MLLRYNLLKGMKEFQQVCKLMERISVLEKEAATSQGRIIPLQEHQSSVNKVVEEHVEKKKNVRHCTCEDFIYTINASI